VVQRTVVSSGRSERSKVVPDGTAIAESTIVEHDFWDLLAEDAPLEPEKVQLVALLTISGAGAGVTAGAAWGSATGEASAEAAKATSRVQVRETIVKEDDLKFGWRCLLPRIVLGGDELTLYPTPCSRKPSSRALREAPLLFRLRSYRY
jgi:hypothetical protein